MFFLNLRTNSLLLQYEILEKLKRRVTSEYIKEWYKVSVYLYDTPVVSLAPIPHVELVTIFDKLTPT